MSESSHFSSLASHFIFTHSPICLVYFMDIIYIVIGAFALAALIGVYLLISVIRRNKPKYWIGLTHAFFAIAAMAFFTVYTLLNQNSNIVSFIIFIFVALLGIYMFYREFFSKQSKQSELATSTVPTPLALLHALAAYPRIHSSTALSIGIVQIRSFAVLLNSNNLGYG